MAEAPVSSPQVLEELLAAMRNLLTVIDDHESRDEEALLAAWKRCNTLSTRFRGEGDGELSEPHGSEMREHLATIARLNAIAAHLVQRESERVTEELARLRTARRTLRDQVDRAAERGSSVDIAG